MNSLSTIAPALLTIAALSTGAHAQSLPACKPLIEYQRDLWLAQSNGTIIARITNDGRLKPAAALQPGGGLAAYSTQDAMRDLVLVDATGRTVDQLTTGASDPIVGLKWLSPTLLRGTEHVGPASSRFHFFTLEPGNRLVRVPAEQIIAGEDCVIGPKDGQPACAVGDAVTLGGRVLYYTPSPFQSASILQAASLALGSSVATNTVPSLRVEFKAQAPGSVTLRVTMPENQWMEQRVPLGQVMTVPLDGGTSLVGLEPTRTGDPSVIGLSVKKSGSGATKFEGNIAWDPSGKRIGLVEANGAGQRSLVLLARQSGQGAITGNGGIDAKLHLPIDGPVSTIKFLTDTRVRIEGASQAVEYTIPASGKVRSTVYSIKPMPPAGPIDVTINGAQVLAEVRDWACP